LAEHRNVFKPAAIIIALAGLVSIVSCVEIYIVKPSYGTLFGVVFVIVYIVVAALEIGMARPMFRIEEGIYRSAMSTIGMALLLRLLLLVTAILNQGVDYAIFYYPTKPGGDGFYNMVIFLNFVFAIGEAITLLLLYTYKQLFMPSPEEIENILRKMGKAKVKTGSECLVCHELVEKDWVLCPQCGSLLSRQCASCGKQLEMRSERCPSCNALVEKSENLQKSVETLKMLSEQEARPEAKSVRYARLAEAYLKAGELDMAYEMYRKAIHYTEFDRKRTNFMVKMAMVMHNAGNDPGAMQVLEGALALDPDDTAGAGPSMRQIKAWSAYLRAKDYLQAGRDADAVKAAEEALSIDPADHNGAGVVKAKVLIKRADALIKQSKPDEAILLLNDATALDPRGETKAASMLEQLAPKTKKKEKRKAKAQKL
jgi:tetratricopeptide (TPR) repeat protein